MNEMTRPIEVITQEIQVYKVQAGFALIEIGKCLLEAKQCLPHGAWGEWLKNEVDFSERTAQNFMKIAKEYKNPQLISDIGNSLSKALALTDLSEEEREEFVGEAHEINGEEKTVAEMTTKELKEVLKELEAERKEKEKLKKQLDLFEDEAQRKQDEADKKVRLAGNQEMAVFKVHFENMQTEFNEMMTCIDNLQEKEPEEAGKMRTAMKSLCQNIMQILEDKQ